MRDANDLYPAADSGATEKNVKPEQGNVLNQSGGEVIVVYKRSFWKRVNRGIVLMLALIALFLLVNVIKDIAFIPKKQTIVETAEKLEAIMEKAIFPSKELYDRFVQAGGNTSAQSTVTDEGKSEQMDIEMVAQPTKPSQETEEAPNIVLLDKDYDKDISSLFINDETREKVAYRINDVMIQLFSQGRYFDDVNIVTEGKRKVTVNDGYAVVQIHHTYSYRTITPSANSASRNQKDMVFHVEFIEIEGQWKIKSVSAAEYSEYGNNRPNGYLAPFWDAPNDIRDYLYNGEGNVYYG